MIFRAATIDDVPALCALDGDVAYHTRCLAERSIVIASRDSDDIGFAMINYNPQYSLYRKLNIPEIQDVFIKPDARQQGAGAALVLHCESMISTRGYEQAGICVALHSGFGAAQRLYAKLGYMPDGFGVTYDRQSVRAGEMRAIDDNLCLMMVKDLKP